MGWSRFGFGRALMVSKSGWEDQPRDSAGMWSEEAGGSSGSSSGGDKPAATATANPDPPKNFRQVLIQDQAQWSAETSKETQHQWDTLSDDEKKSIKDYTGAHYQTLNPALAKAEGDVSKLPSDPPKNGVEALRTPADGIKAGVERLAQALDKGSLPGDTVLFRAVDAQKLGLNVSAKSSVEKIKEALAGKVFTDPTFQSTTTSVERARAFTSGTSRLVIAVKAPAGTKGMWLGDKTRSSRPDESEFLLQKGTRYQFHSVVEAKVSGKSTKIVWVSILPNK